MSRVGNMPIEIPAGVTVQLDEGNLVSVKGPNGELQQQLSPEMRIAIEDNTITVSRPSEARNHRALHGLTRSLMANMVHGVTAGFEKRLTIHGVGYRAETQGRQLIMRLGYSHPVVFDPPEGIELAVEENTRVVVRGADKQAVGQLAAEIRMSRPPEPYKGKGVRYQGEQIRRKAGKAAKVGGD